MRCFAVMQVGLLVGVNFKEAQMIWLVLQRHSVDRIYARLDPDRSLDFFDDDGLVGVETGRIDLQLGNTHDSIGRRQLRFCTQRHWHSFEELAIRHHPARG